MNKQALQKIAIAVLKQYPQHYPTVTFFAKETSVVFKVIDEKGEAFALKIYDDASSQTEDNQIEVLMIEAIKNNGTVSVAEVVNNINGQPISIYTDISNSATYRIVLSKWLAGKDFKDHELPELFIALGKMVADLHEATGRISLPKNLRPKIWDQVFYFRDEKAIYHEPQFDSQVTSEFRELMDAAIDMLQPKLSQIYSVAEPQLLHGDLNPWNIKVQNGELAILDFEDAIYGPPIQDLAILLYYYRDHEHFSFNSIKNWILEGYMSKRAIKGWNDNTIEYLHMARKVNFLNYVLTLEGDYQAYIQKEIVQLKSFIRDQG